VTLLWLFGMLWGAVMIWREGPPEARWLFPAVPLAILGVWILNRGQPFARTWIFLLPFGGCIADVGLLSLCAYRAKKGARQKSVYYAITACFLMLMSLYLWHARAIFRDNAGEIHEAWDAESVVLTLLPVLQADDRICAAVPVSAPVAFYLALYGGDPALLYLKHEWKGRTYVLVDEPHHRVDEIAASCNLLSDKEFYLIKRFPTVWVYRWVE